MTRSGNTSRTTSAMPPGSSSKRTVPPRFMKGVLHQPVSSKGSRSLQVRDDIGLEALHPFADLRDDEFVVGNVAVFFSLIVAERQVLKSRRWLRLRVSRRHTEMVVMKQLAHLGTDGEVGKIERRFLVL